MTNPHGAAEAAKEMAGRIERAREELDRPVTWLAEKSGFAYKTLRTRLYGLPEKFSISELSAISNALGTRLEWIMTGEGEMFEVEHLAMAA